MKSFYNESTIVYIRKTASWNFQHNRKFVTETMASLSISLGAPFGLHGR